MNILIDQCGFQYLNELPADFVPGQIGHFHVGGEKKLGMMYLLESYHGNIWYVHKVTEHTTAAKLRPFIKTHQLYVRKF